MEVGLPHLLLAPLETGRQSLGPKARAGWAQCPGEPADLAPSPWRPVRGGSMLSQQLVRSWKSCRSLVWARSSRDRLGKPRSPQCGTLCLCEVGNSEVTGQRAAQELVAGGLGSKLVASLTELCQPSCHPTPCWERSGRSAGQAQGCRDRRCWTSAFL